MTVKDIIPDEEIAMHHFGRWGDTKPRGVVNEGVLHAMLGYKSGSTMTSILHRHGLIRMNAMLTKKGIRYARALFADKDLREMARCYD